MIGHLAGGGYHASAGISSTSTRIMDRRRSAVRVAGFSLIVVAVFGLLIGLTDLDYYDPRAGLT